MEENKPALFIFMKNDIDSLNPGKVAAQASHATSQLHETVNTNNEAFVQWCKEADHFGTAYVYGIESDRFEMILEIMKAEKKQLHIEYWGVVHDPTYPIKDGAHSFVIPFDTCFWVFVKDSSSMKHICKHNLRLELYP